MLEVYVYYRTQGSCPFRGAKVIGSAEFEQKLLELSTEEAIKDLKFKQKLV